MSASALRTAVPFLRGQQLVLRRPFDIPDPADLAAVRDWVRSAPRPTVVDVFAGAGGLSLGLQDAGFSVLVGSDIDATAVETHVANLRGLGHAGDLTDPAELLAHLEAWDVADVDLVAGGVPCQPFSRAGRSKLRSLVRDGARSADDARAHLWDSFLTVVRALHPRAVLLENVPDLASWDDGAVLVAFREGLRELGYWTDARIMNAADYSVPQYRARLFVVGLRDAGHFSWPTPTARVTLRGAIADLPQVSGGQREETIPYSGPPRTSFQRRLRSGVASDEKQLVHDHITRAVRPDDAEAFGLMPEGGTYADLPTRLQRYRSDIFTDKYKRLAWDDVSRTITAHIAKDGYSYIHPDQDRTLSIREAARLQTFPDWFRFSGHPSQRFKQIGNAVPPMLAEAIGRSIRSALGSRAEAVGAESSTSRFRELLVDWHGSHTRSYPWRRGELPWHVLMAEICLHRTRADQVLGVYRQLVDIAPTPASMLDRRDDVLEITKSLGLRWRAENLLLIARRLTDDHQGLVPRELPDLLALPGVGDYVANAVRCFAFGDRAVLLDTNTERIVARVRGSETPRRWQMRLDLYDLAGTAGPNAAFNYALLDLGASICRPSRPACHHCPVQAVCATGVHPPHTTGRGDQ